MSDIKYEVKFYCCDGRKGLYRGNTITDIHQQIDEDVDVKDFEKDILKYGYFHEFKGKGYKTSNYVIDNGFHCIWRANHKEGKIKLIINKIKGMLE